MHRAAQARARRSAVQAQSAERGAKRVVCLRAVSVGSCVLFAAPALYCGWPRGSNPCSRLWGVPKVAAYLSGFPVAQVAGWPQWLTAHHCAANTGKLPHWGVCLSRGVCRAAVGSWRWAVCRRALGFRSSHTYCVSHDSCGCPLRFVPRHRAVRHQPPQLVTVSFDAARPAAARGMDVPGLRQGAGELATGVVSRICKPQPDSAHMQTAA